MKLTTQILKKKLQATKEQLQLLVKDLATIVCNLPIEEHIRL